MNRSLEEIKRLRKKFHLNQKELALKAGVSQSLIAKVEAGSVEPTYSKAQQIFAALDACRESHEPSAKELMNKKVVFVKYNDSCKETITVMKQKGISQIPVLKNNNVCGLITESTILQKLIQNPQVIATMKVQDVMEDAPPIVTMKASLPTVVRLLQDYPIVLVAQKGDIKGIISKVDVLGRVE